MADIATWLGSLGLAEHEAAFGENGADLALLPELSNEDLKDLGVVRLADRKRLLKAIDALDSGIFGMGVAGWIYWTLGYPDQALA